MKLSTSARRRTAPRGRSRTSRHPVAPDPTGRHRDKARSRTRHRARSRGSPASAGAPSPSWRRRSARATAASWRPRRLAVSDASTSSSTAPGQGEPVGESAPRWPGPEQVRRSRGPDRRGVGADGEGLAQVHVGEAGELPSVDPLRGRRVVTRPPRGPAWFPRSGPSQARPRTQGVAMPPGAARNPNRRSRRSVRRPRTWAATVCSAVRVATSGPHGCEGA